MVAVKTRNAVKIAPLAPASLGAWCTVRVGEMAFADWIEVTPILGQPVTPLLRQAVQTAWGEDALLVEWSRPEPDDIDEVRPQGNCENFAEF